MPKPQPVSLQPALLAILTAALWGGNPIAASFSLDTLPPIGVAAIRFAMATVFMFFWCRWERCGLTLTAEQRVPVLIAGFGMFVQISLFNIGMSMSSSSHGAMLIPTYIFWVNLLEHFVTKGDSLNRRKLLGLSLAATGVLVVLSLRQGSHRAVPTEDVASVAGDIVLLLSAVVLALKVVYMKHVLTRIEPGKLIFWHDLTAVILFFVCSMVFEEFSRGAFTFAASLALLYQGVLVAGLCFAIQAALLQRHSASQIAVFSFVTPLCGVVLAVFFRGDPLSPWLILSTACVTAGIWVIQRSPGERSS